MVTLNTTVGPWANEPSCENKEGTAAITADGTATLVAVSTTASDALLEPLASGSSMYSVRSCARLLKRTTVSPPPTDRSASSTA
jgi:hypothetical protein